MKKKVFILFPVVLLAMLLFKIDVHANCTTDELQALRVEANNLQFEYELVENDDYDVNPTKYYYKIKISNMTKNLGIATDNRYYFYSDVDKDGYLLIKDNYIPGSKQQLYIEASSATKCNREELSLKIISIPYYNEYSLRDECKGLDEYDICKQNTNTTNINEEQFLKYIEDAKNDVEKQQQEKEQEDEKIIEKEESNSFVNFYNKNKKIIFISAIGIVLVAVIISIVVIRIKNKKKIKIGEKL